MSAAPLASGLYEGVVSHRRLRPRRHGLRYRVFMLLFDLDELDRLDGRLRLLKINRPGLLSFRERDHGQGEARGLKAHVERVLQASGLPTGGAIRLLCMPRVLGHGFNPLSVYFCHDAQGELAAILYEVNNTFGERHAYLIPASAPQDGLIEQACEKRFFVSPFMDMEMGYRFRVVPPAEETRVVVTGADADGPLIVAAFAGPRRELNDRALLRAVLTHPLLALGVLAAIHWEALKLFLKGVRLWPRPPAPETPVTVAR